MARLPLLVLSAQLCVCVVAWGADQGRVAKDSTAAAGLNASAGFHYLTTGPCTANDNEIFHYGTRMAASKTLLAVSLSPADRLPPNARHLSDAPPRSRPRLNVSG